MRGWVERQTSQTLGYVEQLYTFGDRDRSAGDDALALPALVVAYLALVREARPAGSADAEWRSWYRYLPVGGLARRPAGLLDPIAARIGRAGRGGRRRGRTPAARGAGRARLRPGFGLRRGVERGAGARTLRTAVRGGAGPKGARSRPPDRRPATRPGDGFATGAAMAVDHRRILATAIGRLRGKIKYRPVVFELMPPRFTLLQLQRTVEALAGVRLHKQNFRRLVEQQGLVEETGEISAAPAAGRPALSASAARCCWNGRRPACACAPPPGAPWYYRCRTAISGGLEANPQTRSLRLTRRLA